MLLARLFVLSKSRTNNLSTPSKEASRGHLVRLLVSASFVSIFDLHSF